MDCRETQAWTEVGGKRHASGKDIYKRLSGILLLDSSSPAVRGSRIPFPTAISQSANRKPQRDTPMMHSDGNPVPLIFIRERNAVV